MKRKSDDSAPSKIWTYGIHEIVDGEPVIREQLYLARQYANALVKIECARRAAFRAVRSKLYPELAELEVRELAFEELLEQKVELTDTQQSELTQLRAQLKQARKRVADELDAHLVEFSPMIATLREQIKAAEKSKNKPLQAELRKQLSAEIKRVKHDPDFLALHEFEREIDAIDEAENATQKKARSECGLFYGTYLLVEKAHDAVRKSVVDPTTKRFDGCGRVGVHILNGMSTAECFDGSSTMFQISEPYYLAPPNRGASNTHEIQHDDTKNTHNQRGRGKRSQVAVQVLEDALSPGERNRYRQCDVQFRVDSDEKGKPIWSKLRIEYHRPITEGRIKDAWILVSKHGASMTYELQLSMESNEFPAHKPPPVSTVAAINFGWRKLDGGSVRVGYLVSSDGVEREFLLPHRFLEREVLPRRLQGFGDEAFNQARRALANTIAVDRPSLPEWLLEECSTIALWKSHAKLASIAFRFAREALEQKQIDRLWNIWQMERDRSKSDYFDSQAQITMFMQREGVHKTSQRIALYLEWWRRKNRHLHQWGTNQLANNRASRDDQFVRWAREIANTYETIVIDDTKLTAFISAEKREAVENRSQLSAGVGRLRQAIVTAAGKERIVKLLAKQQTITCNRCGCLNEQWNTRASHIQHCPCGSEPIDIDRNNALNLLATHCERLGGAPSTGVARGSEAAE